MQITVTTNEAKYFLLKHLGLEAEYRKDMDFLITPHKVEIVNESKLEESSGQS